jgi:hypothetical protein
MYSLFVLQLIAFGCVRVFALEAGVDPTHSLPFTYFALEQELNSRTHHLIGVTRA